jgi:small-conductance mechanosensitive channel
MEGLSETLRSLWQSPVYHAGEAPVLFNQLVIAVLIAVLGLWLVRRGLNALGRHLLARPGASPRGAYTLQKLGAFVAYPLVLLVALPVAGIPITMFAVLGGAFAIGLGFGAQNLLNNLISGVIILLEQPIRVGDVVELESERGRVEDIGTRCVRIRRNDGVHVLVPNSYFLEQRVVNWTLVSADVRGTVVVGVAYGSPVGRVRELMLAAAAEHPNVRKAPAPEAMFEEFGDSALMFTLYFWTDIDAPMDLRRTCSDLRMRFTEMFAENGIVVAFPQRDVHLSANRPLPVRVVEGDAEREGSGTPGRR